MVRGQNGEIASAFRSRNRSDQKGRARVFARRVGVAAVLGRRNDRGFDNASRRGSRGRDPSRLGFVGPPSTKNK
jgi:hypothetical protein